MSSRAAEPRELPSQTPEAWRDPLRLRPEIDAFNVAYARALDQGRLMDWVEFFADDAFYAVTARENHDAGLPVGLVHCEGKGMIHDRAFAISKTAMFAPRYLRHFISNLHLGEIAADGAVEVESNYLLVQTLFDRPEPKLHQVGAYHDRFVRAGDGKLLLARRVCVYDTLLVDNSLVYPV
jgi:anthranilate 1,2-dioxygenase small subunit